MGESREGSSYNSGEKRANLQLKIRLQKKNCRGFFFSMIKEKKKKKKQPCSSNQILSKLSSLEKCSSFKTSKDDRLNFNLGRLRRKLDLGFSETLPNKDPEIILQQ